MAARPQAESDYPKDWFRIAGKDLRRAVRGLAAGDVEDAAFHLQQAIEKSLKGYLLSRGWKLKRTHDVRALLDDATRHDAGLAQYRALCGRLVGYYVVDRYPSFEEGPTTNEVQEAYRQARALMASLKALARGRRRR
jgi:HEPN domain-containing protein